MNRSLVMRLNIANAKWADYKKKYNVTLHGTTE